MKCASCGKEVRQIVKVDISIPVEMKTLSKTNIKSKDVQLISADWGKAKTVCSFGCVNNWKD